MSQIHIASAEREALGVHEFEAHKFSAEASTLGLPPGSWPKQITTDMGNGQPLVMVGVGESGAFYKQSLGLITLNIWND